MFRKLMAGFIALLWSVMALAAVEANKANEAELTSIKGIGPAMSARILEERKSAPSRTGPTSSHGSRVWRNRPPPSFRAKA